MSGVISRTGRRPEKPPEKPVYSHKPGWFAEQLNHNRDFFFCQVMQQLFKGLNNSPGDFKLSFPAYLYWSVF